MNFSEITGENSTYDDINTDKKNKARLSLKTEYFLKDVPRVKALIFFNET